jgi:hypothetical protein
MVGPEGRPLLLRQGMCRVIAIDVVRELRDLAWKWGRRYSAETPDIWLRYTEAADMLNAAADEIERLRAELAHTIEHGVSAVQLQDAACSADRGSA